MRLISLSETEERLSHTWKHNVMSTTVIFTMSCQMQIVKEQSIFTLRLNIAVVLRIASCLFTTNCLFVILTSNFILLFCNSMSKLFQKPTLLP